MASNSGGPPGSGGISSVGGLMKAQDRDYDFKAQLDQAMLELNSVRVQYIDSKRRCDNAQEKLDYYIQQYTSTMGQLEMAHQDIGILREKFTESSNEKLRLQQKVNHLEKKLSRIIESMKLENGNSQTICAFLEQYNELKKKYEQNRGECEKMSKETETAVKRCNDLMEDRNSLALEKDKLKHQLMMATCQFNMAQRERDERMQSLKQNDDVIKELNHVLDTKIIELRRSTEQRNAAEQELSLILSEKDTVLKENQKLSDDLMLVMKKSNEMELRLKEEKHALFYEQERLKRDLEGSLKFRDEIMKECEVLREKLEDLSSSSSKTGGVENSGSSNEHMTTTKSRPEFKSTSNDSWSKEMTDTKEFSVEQHMRELEVAGRENELLRKQLEKVHNEMMKATRDTELAQSGRERAITEREKIVCERDSVKTLCDELRKERDTAISDLLAAIRDSENIKKQNDEACKEIEQLKEHLESQLPPTATPPVPGNPTANCWGCTSARGLESFRKTDTEVVDIDIVGLPTDEELGLMLDGGRDENLPSGDDAGVYVVSVAKDSVCDGKLRPNDCLLKVNNLDCSIVSRRIVLESIRSSGPRCQVVVRRQLMNAMHVYTTQLNLKTGRGHGLSFESAQHIAKVEPGSLAARDKNLAVGDRIISINKRAIDGLTNPNDLLMELDDNRCDKAVIVASRQIGPMNSNRLVHSNKMVNSCTQTEALADGGGGGGAGAFGGTNITSRVGGGSLGGMEATSMSKSASYGLSPSSGSTAAKSTSKLTELLKIIRGKSHKFSGDTGEDSQEQHEAISLLDSVLNSSEGAAGGGKSTSVKRHKRKKDAKEANNKSMGTWPRANIIAHENLTGTIVQKPKRERPTLSVFNSSVAGTAAGMEEQQGVAGEAASHFEGEPMAGGVGLAKMELPLYDTSAKNNSAGGNPISFKPVVSAATRKSSSGAHPQYLMNRHSVYGGTMEITNPILMPKPLHNLPSIGAGATATQTLSRLTRHSHAMDYERQQLAAINRMSLNLTPSDHSLFYGEPGPSSVGAPKTQRGNTMSPPQNQFSPTQRQSQSSFPDVMKSTGFNLPVSPYKLAPHDMPSIAKPPSRDSLDVYGTKKFQRSDYMGVPELASGNTNTLPAYMRNHGGQHLYATNRSTGPKILPTEQLLGSPIQSPVTTQHAAGSSGMLTGASGSISEKSAFDSYMSSSYHHHAANSMDFHYTKHRYQPHQPSREDPGTVHYAGGASGYEGGTFPRKKENQRFRIPSNHSVTSRSSGVKNSTGSIEHHGSERGSPMPMFQVEVLSHGSNINKRNTMGEYCLGQKPSPGDLRRVTIDKSVEPLGITIRCNNNGGGIFVATVTDNSIASQVGLQTGDQLLEVCGLNMRSATYDLAASVLRQCGNTLTMLVQYNPDKYDADLTHSTDDEGTAQSGASTPQNSPGDHHLRTNQRSRQPTNSASKSLGAMVTTKSASNAPQLLHRSLYPSPSSPSPSSALPMSQSILSSGAASVGQPLLGKGGALSAGNNGGGGCNSYSTSPAIGAVSMLPTSISLLAPSAPNIYQEEPRILIIDTKRKSLGISFVGGNKTGIFVHRVVIDSLADSAGIRVGDQILEFNGVDLRMATAEQAYLEIAKPTDKVSVVVQHNMQKFNQIDPDQESIDSLYIKVAFDRSGELGESELKFAKDDVLYVDNTMFTGTPGLWRAWNLDEYGHRIQCGLIPSQTKVEEELRLHQDLPESDTTRRATASARRSFFRRKKHQRSSSDSKELASFSNTQLSYFSDSGMLSDESTISSYIRMERLDYSNYRPVLIIGPLSEFVVDKLNADFPSEFERCKLLPMNCAEETLETNLNNNVYVDYRRRGSIFECTTVQAIKEVRDKKRHGCLEISVNAIERLHRVQIYPIVLLMRFRSAKQIKEVKDSRYSTDKISAKAAKEMYEHSVKLESDFGHLISATISAGVNINHMSSQVKVAVEDEQKKVLWVPYAGASSNNTSI